MSLMGLLERITGKQKERQRRRVAGFRDLVHQVADGEEPDVEAVERILRDNGKTPDDLRAAVELLQRRRELRATVDRAAELERHRPDIERQLKEAGDALEAAEKNYNETATPLQFRRQEISEANLEAMRSRDELCRSCADADLLAEVAEVAAAMRAVGQKIGELPPRINSLRGWAESNRQKIGDGRKEISVTWSEQHARELEELARRQDAEARKLEQELAALHKQMADLQERDRAARERMLEP